MLELKKLLEGALGPPLVHQALARLRAALKALGSQAFATVGGGLGAVQDVTGERPGAQHSLLAASLRDVLGMPSPICLLSASNAGMGLLRNAWQTLDGSLTWSLTTTNIIGVLMFFGLPQSRSTGAPAPPAAASCAGTGCGASSGCRSWACYGAWSWAMPAVARARQMARACFTATTITRWSW